MSMPGAYWRCSVLFRQTLGGGGGCFDRIWAIWYRLASCMRIGGETYRRDFDLDDFLGIRLVVQAIAQQVAEVP